MVDEIPCFSQEYWPFALFGILLFHCFPTLSFFKFCFTLFSFNLKQPSSSWNLIPWIFLQLSLNFVSMSHLLSSSHLPNIRVPSVLVFELFLFSVYIYSLMTSILQFKNNINMPTPFQLISSGLASTSTLKPATNLYMFPTHLHVGLKKV